MDDEEIVVTSEDADAAANQHTSGAIPSAVYSGADIKLVVHLPPPEEGEDDSELREAELELQNVQQQLESAGSDEGSTQLQNRLDEIRLQTETLLTQLAVAQAVEEEDSDEVTALETQLANLGNEGREISEQIQQASVVGATVQELQERESEITEQIAVLREEGAGPRTVTKTLAEITTLSISTHREKYQVRTLGSVYPRSITRGPRTISGSMVFTTFYQHVFHDFFGATGLRSTGVGDWDRYRWTSYITDQLPPMDISIVFANEYGNLSWMSLLGVEFLNEGMVMSIEDLFVEGTTQYIARDFDPIRNAGQRELQRNRGVGTHLTGSDLLARDLQLRAGGRRNPFL